MSCCCLHPPTTPPSPSPPLLRLQLSHKLLHTHYTDLSKDTVQTARGLQPGADEALVRAAATAAAAAHARRYKTIDTVGDPTRKR